MYFSVITIGFAVGFSLILAIGAQNAFVLRQGLKDSHVFMVCLVCALSDSILIITGVAGFGNMVLQTPWIDPIMRWGGAAFLFWYGAKNLHSTFYSNSAIFIGDISVETKGRTLATCLALTWFNPHVYLDTLVLIGTISTQYPGRGIEFALGAISSSFVFFFTLGYGATYLRPIFAKPSSWRVLEAAVAGLMWMIAIQLVMGA